MKTKATKEEALEIYNTSDTFCFWNNGIGILENNLQTLQNNFDSGYYNADTTMKSIICAAINDLDSAIDAIKLAHIRAKELEKYASTK